MSQGKRRISEQIINCLREAEVLLSQGLSVPEVCKRLGICAPELLSLIDPEETSLRAVGVTLIPAMGSLRSLLPTCAPEREEGH